MIGCVLGLDLGTSGIKVVLVDAGGQVIARAERAYGVSSPHPGWAETDPARWEDAARAGVAEVLAVVDADVRAVGIDGQMHGTVLIDRDGQPVRPAVLWPDARAGAQLDAWTRLSPRRRRALANPVTPGMTGPVVAWLVEHEPDVVAQAHRVLLPKDWLRSRLVPGSFVTDPSDASASLLWDLEREDWSHEVIEAARIPARLLPDVEPSDATVGTLSAPVAADWGLPVGIPVVVGCADAAATLAGSRARPGRLVVTIGSGAQAVLPGVQPRFDGPVVHHTYRSAQGGAYAMVAVMNAGIALTRVLSLLGGTWDDLYRPYDRTRRVPTFLPFLAGERLPTAMPSGSGAWSGLGIETERSDLFAAVLEGLCFTIRRAVEAMPDVVDDVIDAAGGGLRSEVFTQTLTDVLGRPLQLVDLADATAVGAALLAFEAAHLALPSEPARAGRVFVPADRGPLADRYARFLAEASR